MLLAVSSDKRCGKTPDAFLAHKKVSAPSLMRPRCRLSNGHAIAPQRDRKPELGSGRLRRGPSELQDLALPGRKWGKHGADQCQAQGNAGERQLHKPESNPKCAKTCPNRKPRPHVGP
jgi:hypothetical protein